MECKEEDNRMFVFDDAIEFFFQVVGLAAKQNRVRNLSNTVMKVKQVLGRRYVEQ